MSLKEKKPALVLIDIQEGMAGDHPHWGGKRNNPDAEQKAAKILEAWRNLKLPIFHVQHSSKDPNSMLHHSHPGFALQEITKPLEGEPLIVKEVNSAFIETDLQERLDKAHIDTLVIVGLTTNHCVSTTTRMAGNFGYTTFLISDATATYDRIGINGETYEAEMIHLTALANLKDEFATILTTDVLLKML
ncbi:cysteine hydrolase family protein [Spongiimicrobium salis]|uniref:cysteine hydrolase family protein n=1 Tax=Spongiimicrobium salis TaxID=1667022 RepID=UPI00374DAFC7